MRRFSSSLLLFFALALTSGCRSIICRSTTPRGNDYSAHIHGGKFVYPGVVSDAKMIHAPWAEGIKDDPQGSAAYMGIPFGVLDMPLSFALDTVLLPFDLMMITAGGRTRDGGVTRF